MNFASERKADSSNLPDVAPILPPRPDEAVPDDFFMAAPRVFAPGLEPNNGNADDTNNPPSRKGH